MTSLDTSLHLATKRMRERKGLITLNEALALGVSRHMVKRLVERGEWTLAHRGVYRAASVPSTAEQETLAAVLAAGAGAVASHQSAGWLWGLCPAPNQPCITSPRCQQPRVPGIVLHRTQYLRPEDVHLYKGIPCTSPLQAIVDMAATAETEELNEAIDRLLSTKMGTVAALEGELERRAGRGRRGVGILRDVLKQRGLIGAPAPSVLESKTDRLLKAAAIEPLGAEIKTGDGWYRVDYLIVAGVILEVAGHAYHWSPEQRRRDEERRNRLILAGNIVLTYTWRDITGDPLRVIDELREAIKAKQPNAKQPDEDPAAKHPASEDPRSPAPRRKSA